MAIVTLDIEDGYSASHDILSGWDYTRAAMVEELPFGTSADDLITIAEAALVAAPDLSAGSVTGVVGNRGSKYTMGQSGISVYLKAFVPEIVSPQAVKFKIVYRGYPVLVFEFDGALNQIESNIDVNGTPIRVAYTYPANYGSDQNGGDTNKAGKRFIQGVMVPRDEPEPVFSFKFLVVAGSNLSVNIRGNQYNLYNADGTSLMSVIVAWQGCCNNDTYTIGAITGTKHQWKIIRVTGVSRDQGLTYEAAMYMQYRPSGWDKVVTFNNPDTGQPPPDVIVSKVQVTDPTFPAYAGYPNPNVPDVGSTIAATASEATFPSFGNVQNATFPDVKN